MMITARPSDDRIRRWMQIKRLNREEVDQLHDIESGAEARRKKNGEGPDWLEAGVRWLIACNNIRPAFWSRAMIEEQRMVAVEKFTRHIFPIWCPIWANLERDQTPEMDAVHRVDNLIWADPIQFPPASGAGRTRAAEQADLDLTGGTQ